MFSRQLLCVLVRGPVPLRDQFLVIFPQNASRLGPATGLVGHTLQHSRDDSKLSLRLAGPPNLLIICCSAESTPSRRPAVARQENRNTHIAVPPRPLAPAQPAENPVGRPRGPRSPVEWILHAPMLVIGGGIQLIVTIVSGSLSAVGFVGSRILPQPILRFFQSRCPSILESKPLARCKQKGQPVQDLQFLFSKLHASTLRWSIRCKSCLQLVYGSARHEQASTVCRACCRRPTLCQVALSISVGLPPILPFTYILTENCSIHVPQNSSLQSGKAFLLLRRFQ